MESQYQVNCLMINRWTTEADGDLISLSVVNNY